MKALFLSALLLAPPLAAQTEAYAIDPVHSQIGFRIRHLVAKTAGRFTRFTGTVHLDAKAPERAAVELQIDASSISTDNDARDKHLRSPDFFDVAKHPSIAFRSSAIRALSQGRFEVSGTLSMRGVSRTIRFPITFAGTAPGPKPGSVVAGFVDGALSLDRTDYGISAFPGVLGREVEVTLNIEAGR